MYIYLQSNYDVHRCDWLEWRGNKYYQNDFVLCGFGDDDSPQFGKVHEILFIEKRGFLLVQLYYTQGIDYHYNCYVLKYTDKKKLLHICDENEVLGMLHPMQVHYLKSFPGNLFIVTKTALVKL